MELFEAIYTQRAMRRLKPDPVPDELIWQIIDAAIHAPNGGNLQPWNFLVIKDYATKLQLQEYYIDGLNSVTRPNQQLASNAPRTPEERERAKQSPARYLADHLAEVPVLILCSVRLEDVASTTPPGACIFPAVQNLMLAARALGLGTVLTTVIRHREADVRRFLGIPDGVWIGTLIPVGWPVGKFGPNVRKPAEEVTFLDRWGQGMPRETDAPAAAPQRQREMAGAGSR